MRLIKLHLRNFKGIKDFTLDANGESINVYGENATGKTTLYDAFLWLLFSKDSQNKSDFEIKTLDPNNRAIHNLEHEVEGVFEIGGKTVSLKKVFSEKWTKKRGSINEEFTGHSTDYFLNRVPVKEKEYLAYIDSFTREDIFKLLTSPTYFNIQMKWQDRRKILMDICGGISDDEVIFSNQSLGRLPEILQGRSIEDHRRIIAARRAEINKELEKIPVRIDETQRGLPDTSGLSLEQLKSDLNLANAKLTQKQQEVSRIENGGEASEKRLKLREVEAEILSLETEFKQAVNSQIQGKQAEVNQFNSAISDLKTTIANHNRTIDWNRGKISSLEKSMEKLRRDWLEKNSQELSFKQKEVCPTCGQAIPPEKLDEAKRQALESFNLQKSDELERITQEGRELKISSESLKSEIAGLEKLIANSQSKLSENELNLATLLSEIQSTKAQVPVSGKLDEKINEKKSLIEAIALLQNNTQQSLSTARNEIEAINSTISAIRVDIAKFDQFNRDSQRVEELKQQEKMLAKEYEKLEGELYLTEEFVRSKVNLLEAKINHRFKLAKFKMYETQLNGGIQEVCDTLYNGVPYSGGLNNAARINVGLDIVSILQEHYGFKPTVWIDNKESVTELIPMDCQVISLIVSETDKKLRVEYPEKSIKEAV